MKSPLSNKVPIASKAIEKNKRNKIQQIRRGEIGGIVVKHRYSSVRVYTCMFVSILCVCVGVRVQFQVMPVRTTSSIHLKRYGEKPLTRTSVWNYSIGICAPNQSNPTTTPMCITIHLYIHTPTMHK